MPRPEQDDLIRVHIWLQRDDTERIKELFGSRESLGFSKAIRMILRQYIKHVDAKAARTARPVSLSDDLGSILDLRQEESAE